MPRPRRRRPDTSRATPRSPTTSSTACRRGGDAVLRHDAKLDHQTVVALVGQTALTVQGGGFYQEIDLLALYKDVAGFLAQLDHPSQVRHLVDRACRTALAHRTVAVLVLPNDVQDDKAIVDPPHRHAHYATSNAPSSRTTTPPEADLRAAADVLRGGEKVAMPVGQGAYGAEAEVVATAERLGAGVATSLLALPVVDQREPWVTGAIGLLGTRPSWHLMQECDRLLIVGSAMPYSEFYPPEGRPAVQIDVDGAQLGLRYPAQVNLTGDAAPTLRALLSLLDDRDPPTAWRADLGRRTASWRALQRRVARQQADPVNPQRVLTELDDRLPADAMLAVDCGTVTAWCARHLHVRPGMLASLSGTLLSMGGALPYGIAAKFAHPDRPVFALLGDGAMQMNGVNELITVAKYWREWQDPRFVVLVLDNRDLAFVSWEQRSTEGTPKFDAGRRPRRRRPRLGRGAGRGPARRDRRRRRPPRGPDPAARHPRAGRQHHGSGDPRRLRLAGDPASRAAGHRGDVAAPPALTPGAVGGLRVRDAGLEQPDRGPQARRSPRTADGRLRQSIDRHLRRVPADARPARGRPVPRPTARAAQRARPRTDTGRMLSTYIVEVGEPLSAFVDRRGEA